MVPTTKRALTPDQLIRPKESTPMLTPARNTHSSTLPFDEVITSSTSSSLAGSRRLEHLTTYQVDGGAWDFTTVIVGA